MSKSLQTPPKYARNWVDSIIKKLRQAHPCGWAILELLYKIDESIAGDLLNSDHNRYYHYRQTVKYLDILYKDRINLYKGLIEVADKYKWRQIWSENVAEFKRSGYSQTLISNAKWFLKRFQQRSTTDMSLDTAEMSLEGSE